MEEIVSKNPERLDLFDAAERGETEVVRFLLEGKKGDDMKIYINARGAWLRTPLHWASQHGHEETVKLLIELGAMVSFFCSISSHHKVDIGDDMKWTALHWACNNGHTKVVKTLLVSANVNAEDTLGRTPLQLAKKKKIQDMIIGCISQ